MILLALLLGTLSNRLLMVDETVRIRPGEFTTFNLSLQQRPAVVDLAFKTQTPSPTVSVALLGPPDGLVNTRERRQFLRAVSKESYGAFRFPARRLGDYEILVDNRENKDKEAVVALKVTLGFNEPGTLRPETVSPERRLSIVAVSLAFFGAVVAWSGRKLLAAIESRKRDEQLRLF